MNSHNGFGAPVRSVHLMGICGTGMAALAGLFKQAGYDVTGSDQSVYPPMSDLLRALGIIPMHGYKPENLAHNPDLVIVGNVIRKTNPEAQALESSGIKFLSMPDALTQLFAAQSKRIVVTGTHGKTTVTSMIAWILQQQGLEPGFLIGGIAKNFLRNYQLGAGDYFVIEGDEYDTAYFDKTPKFLHYQADIGIITSCEYDHADIYGNVEEIETQFSLFLDSLADDPVIAAADDSRVAKLIARRPNAVTYGLASGNNWNARWSPNPNGILVSVFKTGRLVAEAVLPIIGKHNVTNALAAIAAVDQLKIDPNSALDSLKLFQGVRRRQEILGSPSGITVIDDFAHHPTAVKETCEAVKFRFPESPLIAVFEPRTNTSRLNIFQQAYAESFDHADVVLIKSPSRVDDIDRNKLFDVRRLAEDLIDQSKSAYAFNSTGDILKFLVDSLRPNDVVLIMSNGSFDGLQGKLMQALGGIEDEGSTTLR